MSDPLQQTGWKQSQYERPTHGWVCGRLCDGTPCQFGPDSRGSCQVRSQCTPEMKGDRYVCTRAAIEGGPCKDGPLPDGSCCQPDARCQPKRNLFGIRRRVSACIAAACLAFCLFVFGGNPPAKPMLPGEVTFQHSAVEHNCATCHVAAELNAHRFAEHSFDADIAIADSKLCLKCHTEIGPQPFLPHTASHQTLASLSGAKQLGEHDSSVGKHGQPLLLTLASLVDAPSQLRNDELACSVCHQEHRGKDFDLKQLGDLRCQSCHADQFHSFSDGHPEISDFAYARRPRIYFDHARHLSQYFVDNEFRRLMPDGKSPTACLACHEPEPSGLLVRTRGYDQMCSACHADEITDRETPGIPFLAIPDIDLPTDSDEAAAAIGQWPGRPVDPPLRNLPPFMQLLLTGDQSFQAAATALNRAGFDADPQSSAIVDYHWGIKSLLYDVLHDGQAAISARLGDGLTEAAANQSSIVPSIVAASRVWFPNLAAEAQARQQEQPLPASDPADAKPALSPIESTLGGGWYLRDADHSIRYRPTGHADPLLRAWLDTTVRVLIQQAEPDAQAELFRQLVNPSGSGRFLEGPTAAGRCLQCHTVDRHAETGELAINWHARRAVDRTSLLTHFSHGPHMQLPIETGCISCHQVAPEVATRETYHPAFFERTDDGQQWHPVTDWRSPHVSGFEPISKQRCAVCHVAESAGDSCLKCHAYHAVPVGGHISDFWKQASRLPQPARQPDSSGEQTLLPE